ncbi:MAG: histidine phosphatase family protein [Deltaproteobacteria bacterium]|nr:histidine phosphatase family protein [Deltaproteobacteria bacterium]
MPLRLYFLRHGQTSLSRDNMFCGSGTDAALTAEGTKMAEAFAEHYRTLSWEAVYCSPLSRAVATASPLANHLTSKIIVRDEIKEIYFGAWEGLGVSDVSQKFHDDYIRWSADPAWNAPSGGGETSISIARRSRALTEEIRATYSDGNILLVSHKATIRIMLCDLLGIDISRFRDRLACPVASVSMIEFGSRGPLLKMLADREHLSKELRELPGT